ncbi:hypothetical protein DEO72_LG4g1024 [Vigna unguiculata]|uniref:Uncharacterized protein n=1 Tax=Vigna unguiculata TaxID=3917 RepID=A0A4D6LNH4_VIGUN|nr:hypothetical protein DEO72_LG4g1024 [Vigna unguiculata]
MKTRVKDSSFHVLKIKHNDLRIKVHLKVRIGRSIKEDYLKSSSVLQRIRMRWRSFEIWGNDGPRWRSNEHHGGTRTMVKKRGSAILIKKGKVIGVVARLYEKWKAISREKRKVTQVVMRKKGKCFLIKRKSGN